jgi:hypothetical protein
MIQFRILHLKPSLILECRGYSFCDEMLCFHRNVCTLSKNQTPWPESASELYRPSDRFLSEKLVPTFADRGCHVVRLTDLYGRFLGFIDRSRYLFVQAAPHLCSRGWMDPVPHPPLLRKSGSAGNRTRTSGPVTRSSDHYTTEAVIFLHYIRYV